VLLLLLDEAKSLSFITDKKQQDANKNGGS